MKFSVFQLSRQGGRRRNEDRLGYTYSRDAALFVLADGMGGHPQGDRAAHLAVQHSLTLFAQQAQPRLPDVTAFLCETLLDAHREILRDGTRQALLDYPRTTLVMAVVQDGQLHWVHCGDSRLYWLRHGTVLARTRDHSLAEQALHAGAAPVNRNVLFTCLGSPSTPIFALAGPGDLQPEDQVVLCSDGLWSQISESALTQGLARAPLDQAVPDVVEQALRVGGARGDNVSCLALQWHALAGTQPAAAQPGHAVMRDDAAKSEPTRSAAFDDSDLAQAQQSLAEIEAALARSAPRRRGTPPTPSGETP
ncbi:MAG: protein phosphatase 2C domain-containing protein [Rhodoferax sp.]